jgi:hypothetical protein
MEHIEPTSERLAAAAAEPPRAQPVIDAKKREEVLAGLCTILTAADRAAVGACAERLLAALPDQTNPFMNAVLVPYGGGKDSSFVLAFIRAVQLHIARNCGDTFTLRAVTNYQSGMAVGVTENIDRVYRALGLYDDPKAELLVVAGTSLLPFHPDFVMPAQLLQADRLSILMNGHHTGGSNRATFCNACNFGMVRSFSIALNYRQPACLIITGDSEVEQRSYFRAVHGVARDLGLPRPKGGGFRSFLRLVDDIGAAYSSYVYGLEASQAESAQIDSSPAGELRFFSAFADTQYDANGHWELLTEFLGFSFDDLAFSFSESDCANPALMAHLRGLKAEHLWKRSYAEGVAEYCKFGLALMEQKRFPRTLIERMRRRYADEAAISVMRRRMQRYAEDILGLTDGHLVCMLFAPFTAECRGLDAYLSNVRPQRQPDAEHIRGLLRGERNAPALVAELTDWSGLTIESLQALYKAPLSNNTGADTQFVGPIRVMFRHEPHQAPLATQHSSDGCEIVEIESGR